LLPGDRSGARSPEETFAVEDYASELRLPSASAFVGRTVADLESLGEGEAQVTAIIRERFRRYVPQRDWTLEPDDIVVLTGDAPALQRLVQGAGMLPVGAAEGGARGRRSRSPEAVVLRDSTLSSARPHGAPSCAAVSASASLPSATRASPFINGSTRRAARGRPAPAPGARRAFRRRPPRRRPAAPGGTATADRVARRPAWVPVGIVVVTMAVLAFQLLPVAIAFLAAATAMVLSAC
jgi:hypothetical protein